MKIILAFILVIAFVNVGCASSMKREEIHVGLSKEEVLGVANSEAIKLGYDIGNMIVDIDENNDAWNKHISSGLLLKSNIAIRDKLKDKEYWAVYYAPKEMQFGGDLWIIVDNKSGEILVSIKGK